MDKIEHKMVKVNGINMHVAEKGQGPIVLLLHGFPELWYSWRHQIAFLSSNGYRAIAPDLRGYGDSDTPERVTSYTCHHVVGDVIALLDLYLSGGGGDGVFVVAHDWGAIIGWYLCLFRPDRVKGYVCLSVPFIPRNPHVQTLDGLRSAFGEDYYMCRFQEPGKIEAEMEKFGTKKILKMFISTPNIGPPCLPKENPFGIGPNPHIKLPSWFTEEDLDYYHSKYEHKGFTGPLNYYRSLDLNWELMAPWTGVQVKVPVKYVVGDDDVVYTTAGAKEYIHNGGFKKDVPLLEDVVVMTGAGHFIQQQKPDEINTIIYSFISKF